MSITEDKLRIETAVSDIKTEIINKGVDVPEGTRIDGLPSLISSIPSGGDDETLKAIIDRSIKNVTVPDGVTNIGNYAFYYFKNLDSVVLPNSIKNIGDYAFDHCGAKIELPNGLETIGKYAFSSCNLFATELPETITSIDIFAFWTCYDLKISKVPNGVTNIKNSTFRQCTRIETFEFHSGIMSVDSCAFYNTPMLKSVTFKGTPNSIAADAFKPYNNVSNLTEINVPWSEGTVANAPWGATNATINYNYTEE